MYPELRTKNPYLDNHQPSELWTHIQDYPKTYITRTQSAWYSCVLNARHDWLNIPIRKVATTMESASKGTNNQRETSFLVYHTLVKAWRIRPENYPFFSQFRIAGFVKQVVLLWPQNSFCHLKSDLPTATAVERLIAVSLCERGRFKRKRTVPQLLYPTIFDSTHHMTLIAW